MALARLERSGHRVGIDGAIGRIALGLVISRLTIIYSKARKSLEKNYGVCVGFNNYLHSIFADQS